MIRGTYYDGRSARRQEVWVSIGGGHVSVRGDGVARQAPLAEVEISDRLDNAPRMLRFADGATVAIEAQDALDRALALQGVELGFVDRLQRSWPIALTALVVSIAAVAAGSIWGLPWVAERAAQRVPAAVAQTLGDEMLSSLDRTLLEPSALPAPRRQALAARFAALRAAQPGALLFRSSPGLGPNAMALPSGAVILLDELVALSDDDDELVAVLAHELGHIHGRHSLRLLIQSSIVGLFATWLLGDVSVLLAAAPTLLLHARYSRSLEREADTYAAQRLAAQGLSPLELVTILEKLEAAHAHKRLLPHDGTQDAEGWDYLDSHPSTAARKAYLTELAQGLEARPGPPRSSPLLRGAD